MGDPMSASERIENNFVHHAPKDDQVSRYDAIRSLAKVFALMISAKTPASREQSLALTKLEECVFWANASIGRNE